MEAGYQVDLYVDEMPAVKLTSVGDSANLNVICVVESGQEGKKAQPRSKVSSKSRIKRMPGWAFVRDLYVLFGWKLPHLVRYGAKCCRMMKKRGPYDVIIGAENMGLVTAGVFARFSRGRLVYWCLELITWKDAATLLAKFFKWCEMYFAQAAEIIVIQDQERAKIFSRENKVSSEKIVIVPACARGPARKLRTRYFHKRYQLSDDVRIALHAGSIERWSQCLELIDAARDLPADWKLVVHGFGAADYIDKVIEAAGKATNVIVSPDFVPYAELDNLIAGADVGVAMYEASSVNWQLMGAASSKVAQYLKVGVPVIHNSAASLKDVTDTYGCGVFVSNPKELGSAAGEIYRSYSTYVDNAIRCFNEVFDYDRYIDAFLSQIAKASPLRGRRCETRKHHNSGSIT
ncbi:MAG: hypothetical protein DLM73_14475 [Chthoniobacterales bacterium]|nr:MAG: hypothetical protein DLM73_14475 [Chthoniobacterales bacterium]